MERAGSLREAMRQNMRAQQQQRRLQREGGGAAGGAQQQQAAFARAYRSARQSGALNLSTRNLKTFPMDVLRLHELVEADEKSWECAELQKVDLSYNEIPSLPTEIDRLRSLVSFKMRHNQLQAVPDTLFDITTLVSLDLSNNAIEGELSDALGRLSSLRDLSLANNKLSLLPESPSTLVQLESLQIEENALRALPSDIGNMKRLRTLTLHSNCLSELPESFAQLSSITTLDVKKNVLTTFGRVLERFSHLKFLDARQNRLQEFPSLPLENELLDQVLLGFNCLDSIDDDSVLRVKDSLTVLDLRDNKLKQLPDRVAHLYRLKTLDLSNNDLHDLPPALGYLKYLQHLVIDGNPLRSIRRSIISSGTEPLKKYLRTRGSPPEGVEALEEELDEFALRAKRQREDEQGGVVLDPSNESTSQHEYMFRDAASSGTLQLTGMRLQELPVQLIDMSKYRLDQTLLQLNLSKNRLETLPQALGQLLVLQTLIAEECGLRSVHASIALLPQLQHLRLRKNALTSEAIEAWLDCSDSQHGRICYSLKELDLRNNQLSTIPSRFQHLSNVDTLLLSYNRMRSLEGLAWESMGRLSVLSVADNQLESMGNVYDAPLLTSLSVENNNLRHIPIELGRCEHLRALYVVGNPQRSIRLNIVHEGPEAILAYLRNRLPMGSLTPTKPASAPATSIASNTNTADTENRPPSNQRVTIESTSSTSNQRQRASPNPADYKRARRGIDGPAVDPVAIAQPDFGFGSPRASAPVESPPAAAAAASASAATPNASGSVELFVLEDRIKALELQLEDFAITQAKKYALKKELAMVRSQKIRHLRKLNAS